MSYEDAAQQWQFSQAAPAQPLMMGVNKQCYLSPQAPGILQPMALGAETWMCNASPSMTPYTGFHCGAGELPVGWTSQASGHATAPWPQMSPTHTADSLPPIVIFVPAYSVEQSLGYAAAPCHSTWQQVPATAAHGFSQFSHTSVAPTAMPPNIAGLLDLYLDGAGQTSSGTEAQSPLATGFCTPEITPRYAPDVSATLMQEAIANLVGPAVAMLSEPLDPREHDAEINVDAFSEYDSSEDDQDHVCWDFDIHAALLIRAKRDTSSYASSETSTAVSRTSRRRRARRVAKVKSRSTMPILESPPIEEVLTTEEKKTDLINQLELGGDSVHKAVSSLLGSVLKMSLEPLGCRVIQSALDVASTAEKEALVAELRTHVQLATTSPHANFVIQKVIEVLPVNSTNFVAEELLANAADVAQHRFGCRVLSRLVEHHLCGNVASSSTNKLIDQVLLETDQLIRHNFARHVLELILEHGSEAHKHIIANTIRSNAIYYAKNRCASYVVEKALSLCSASDTHAIVSALMADSKQFLMLAVHECGVHVVQALMRSNTEPVHKAKELLLEDVQNIKASKYGKRLLEEVGLMGC